MDSSKSGTRKIHGTATGKNSDTYISYSKVQMFGLPPARAKESVEEWAAVK